MGLNSVEVVYRVTLLMALVTLLILAYLTGRASVQFERRSSEETRSTPLATWWAQWLQGISTEMVGAFLTAILLSMLVGAAQEQRNISAEKERLILQMGSPFNESAVEAARQLATRGWLTDGSLQEANLLGANLQGANLAGANLRGAYLWDAALQGAYLSEANLQEAFLVEANLQGALLGNANLQETRLETANLQGAEHLTCDQLRQAELSGAILPDSTRLPEDSTWREALDAWCETAAVDENGYIVPAED